MTLEELLARGEEALEEAHQSGLGEGLHLDFKGQADSLFSQTGDLTKDGRRSLAKAASAFSNSGGGIIVLGVDCRKIDGVDAISALHPIPNFARAYSSVNAVLSDLIQPKHDGLRLHKFAASSEVDRGYMVIEVPRSERRPHMSSADHLYYRRSGSSSHVMEHYDIEDAFRRVSSPILRLSWNLSANTTPRMEPTIEISFLLTNDGATTAKYTALRIWRESGPTLRVDTRHTDFGIKATDDTVLFTAPSDLVLNPRQSVPYHSARVPLRRIGEGHWEVGGLPAEQARIDYQAELSAENMMPIQMQLSIEAADLSRYLRTELYQT